MNFAEAEGYFKQYRDSLNSELSKLSIYIRLYRRLHERMDDRLEEMYIAPAFFSTTIEALFSAIVLWVEKLFGKQLERGLIHIINFIEQHRQIFDIKELRRRANYAEDDSRLKNRQPITTKRVSADRKRIKLFDSFKRRRDKYHAHFDKQYFFDRTKLLDDAPLAWDDLEQVIGLGKEILNGYSADYDGNVFVIEPVNATDIDYLLDRLHCRDPEQQGTDSVFLTPT